MARRTVSRRGFLASGLVSGLGVASMVVSASCDPSGAPQHPEPGDGSVAPPLSPVASTERAVVPLETERHRRCWMAWPASRAIWGGLLPGIQSDIARIASTVARYEPVVMCANPQDANTAATMCGDGVEVIDDVPVDDCWTRDSGPVFTIDERGSLGAVGLNFNGWGGRQMVGRDAGVARAIADREGVPFATADLITEGGAVETDGAGTLLATESSIINDNRNPGRSKDQLEAAMCAAYGADQVLWVPGLRDRDITDDHIDATSRFVRPGLVMVQVPPAARNDVWALDARQQRELLSLATDARGRALTIVDVHGPTSVRSSSPDFLDSYVNFYPANGAVLTPQLGDTEADRAAAAVLADTFGREVVQLNVDRLHAGGGGIHCVTQQEPMV